MLFFGCVAQAPPMHNGHITCIGEPRDRDTSEMGRYEIAVNTLLDHLSDTAVVLSQIEDPDQSRWAASLVDEARPRFVEHRLEMKLAELDKAISYPELVVRYGGTYLWATLELEQQMGRIKKIGPDTYDPIKSALLRLKQDLDDAGLPSEP